MAAMLATPVSAANNIVVQVELGLGEFSGWNAGSHKTVDIVWRASDGALKSKQSVKSDGDGYWWSKSEDEVVEPGDTIKMTVGTSSRTYTVKRLTLRVNRVTDVVSGEAPPGSAVAIEVHAYDGGFFDWSWHGASIQANSSGFYSHDFTGGADPADIRGWDSVIATQTNARGDATVYGLSVNAIRLWSGRATFDLVGNPGKRVELSLARSATTLVHMNAVIGPDAFLLRSAFVDKDGIRVRAAAGDTIETSLASDASFVIPNIAITVDKTADKVTANCGIGADKGIQVLAHDRYWSAGGDLYGRTNASGDFVANFGNTWGLNIRTGWKVEAYCKLASGDVVVRIMTVP